MTENFVEEPLRAPRREFVAWVCLFGAVQGLLFWVQLSMRLWFKNSPVFAMPDTAAHTGIPWGMFLRVLTAHANWLVLSPLLLVFFRWIESGNVSLKRVAVRHLVIAPFVGMLILVLMSFEWTYIWHMPNKPPVTPATYAFMWTIYYSMVTSSYLVHASVYHSLSYLNRLRANERAVVNANLRALEAQLRPHFLFNSLNMIASHVRETPELAGRLLQRLSDLLRYVLAGARSRDVRIEREMDFVRDYLVLQAARFEGRLDVSIEIDDSASGAIVPPLVLQPLVENAVVHGMRRSLGKATITVRAERVRDRLCLTVRDDHTNGRGPTNVTPAMIGNGIGMRSARARLRSAFGTDFTLDLVIRVRGATATIDIPFSETAPNKDVIPTDTAEMALVS